MEADLFLSAPRRWATFFHCRHCCMPPRHQKGLKSKEYKERGYHFSGWLKHQRVHMGHKRQTHSSRNGMIVTFACEYIVWFWFTCHFDKASEIHIKLDHNFNGNITTWIHRVLDGRLTVGSTGGQSTPVGFCWRYSRNVTATDAQLLALHSQHVPHGRTRTLDLLWETTGTKGWGVCGGAGWVRLGPRGWLKLCTLNAHIAFWEGRLTSSPLLWNKKQQQERNSTRVRSIVTNPEWDTVLQKMRKLLRKGERKRHYVRTVSVSNIRPFIMRHCYVRWNKSTGIYKQTMGKVTELQSFFISRHEMTSVHAINHVALKWKISRPKWNYLGAGAEGLFQGRSYILSSEIWPHARTRTHTLYTLTPSSLSFNFTINGSLFSTANHLIIRQIQSVVAAHIKSEGSIRSLPGWATAYFPLSLPYF